MPDIDIVGGYRNGSRYYSEKGSEIWIYICRQYFDCGYGCRNGIKYNEQREEGILMSKQKLMMKYHPAKKEVEFHRFQNGKEVAIRNDSALTHYMDMKGTFVLQDFGNRFFDDIAKAFDGLTMVDIEVVTTKLDYEDFLQMVEHYNADSKCKMNPTLLAELPDMNQTFLEVMRHGEESIGVLEAHRQKLFEIPLENDNVRKSAENFAHQIDEEIRNIKEKIDSFIDNNVSLCFAGVYSAGKSALINAILGYRILPEDIKSETAKMFQISSPRDGEPVKICFDITSVYTELEWNAQQECFEFVKGPSENPVREGIQMIMNANKEEGLRQHEQIKKLLDKLNSCPEVATSIQIRFPVSLDSKNVQFTIYDTPGTDSNYLAHQQVLMEALEKQRQSILIFVGKPDGLEGSGNNVLLNYLKTAEKKSSKTSIDIARSLFVINKADGQTADTRITLQTAEIKGENQDKDKDKDAAFSIKLKDKKLFFTSALYAYAAKAVKNGVAMPQEQALLQGGKFVLAEEGSPMGYCYRQDRCATSEVATDRMLKLCEEALADARKAENDSDILVICSGLYALEREIQEYGEKYASAVKAYAIIDSVDKALNKLSNQADSLKESNQEQISGIERAITELRETITEAIEGEYNNITIRAGQKLPLKVLARLKLDSGTLQSTIIGHTKDYLDEKIKGWFFGIGKVRFKEKDKDIVKSRIAQVIENFTNTFLKERKSLLEEQRDTFMAAVKKAIEDNGMISESAKKIFLDIPKPVVTKPNKITDMGQIYDAHKRVNKVLWIKQENLDKDGFIKEIEENLTAVARAMADDYTKDYRNSLETLLMQIKSIFESNLHQYSVNMRAMMEDKEAMKKLGNRVSDAARELSVCQDSLNRMIWRESNNE